MSPLGLTWRILQRNMQLLSTDDTSAVFQSHPEWPYVSGVSKIFRTGHTYHIIHTGQLTFCHTHTHTHTTRTHTHTHTHTHSHTHGRALGNVCLTAKWYGVRTPPPSTANFWLPWAIQLVLLSVLEICSLHLEKYWEIPICCSKRGISKRTLFSPYHHLL